MQLVGWHILFNRDHKIMKQMKSSNDEENECIIKLSNKEELHSFQYLLFSGCNASDLSDL